MTPADAPIVSRVLGGDREAFRILVDRHYGRCVRIATHLLGNREDAEDAAQETFLRAYRHLAKYEERERFAAWLLRILTNQCRTQLARRRAEAARDAVDDVDAEALPLDEPLPSERAGLREELRHALACLPPDQREAVVLRFGEELTYDEMAAVTGAGVSALKMRVQRACARLRTLLLEVPCV